MKAYIIMEKGFEYDDNNYNPVDGGTPRKVFFTLKDAEKELTTLEIEHVKTINVSDFMQYEMEDDLNVEKEEFESYVKSLNDKYGLPPKKNSWDRVGEHQLNPKATYEESIKYLQMISPKFFEIESVEVDIPSLRDYQISQVLS